MKTRLVALSIFLCAVISIVSAQKPRVYLMDADTLMSIQAAVFGGDKRFAPAVKKLLRDSEKAMKTDIVTIIEKEILPPSGDKHDYFSLSRYWWPDPSSPDGLPYIRKDGQTNPESESIPDHKNLNQLFKVVTTLSLAYFYSGEEKYAERGEEWLRKWFIDPETKMNPHLRFAQQVRGRDVERGTGILDAREFSQLVDAIGIIRLSLTWTPADDAKIKQWFTEYLQWLVESPNGRQESAAKNNHGTWYDVQTTAVALFVGDKARAQRICEEAKEKRIAHQITPEGKQPEELARTLSWHYSQFNLFALSRLADLARHVNVDLWLYSTDDGRSLRTALHYLIPFAYKEKKWEETQIKDFNYDALAVTAMRASAVLNERKFIKVFDRFFDGNKETDRLMLQYGILSMTE